MPGPLRLFICCFVASGAAALLYQVVWTRLFTLTLGHTVAAASTVLAAVMGGLAAGAWLAGRFEPRPDRRLHCYAALEIFVAAAAVSLPFVLEAIRPLLAWAYADGGEPLRFGVVRVVSSLLLLTLPTLAMGATFPIGVAWLADALRSGGASRPPASGASLLYAANTAGAAAGAIGAGFWLIPAIGLRGTTAIGVVFNSAAAAGAIWLARRPIASARVSPPVPAVRPVKRKPARSARISPAPPRLPPQRSLACLAAALSGLAALAYEVTWTRVLALVIGPTTYAFATMAAAFIAGLAIGAAAGSRLVRRVSRPDLWTAGLLLTTAGASWTALWIAASRLPLYLASELSRSEGFEPVLLRQVLIVTPLLLPIGMSLGATFSMALATASSGAGTIGRDSARVYAANTCGAVAGALLAGFVLLPRLGLQGTTNAIGALTIAGGAAIALRILLSQPNELRVRAGATVVAGCVLIPLLANLPAWDRDLLSSGAYKYARNIGVDELAASLRAGTLEYYKEGAAATVAVRRRAGTRALVIDGKVDASNGADMLTQRLLGLLPVVLHPEPRDVLVIGLGSGVTVEAALASGDVQRADVVEISPEVVEASDLFALENGNVLQAPGVRLIAGDGRSHLLLGTRQYDVIISEPSNPWMAGVAALFTQEFFAAARDRLKPGGLLCQWAHTYEIDADDLASIAATFSSVFPEGTMWLVGEGDLLLIGRRERGVLSRLDGLDEWLRAGSIPKLLEAMSIPPDTAPFVLLSHFVGGPAELAAYGGGAALQTDDRMALEFTAPAAMYARDAHDNVRRIRELVAPDALPPAVASAFRDADAPRWSARGRAALEAQAYGVAYESFRHAATLDDRDAGALRGATDAAAAVQRLDEAQQWLEARAARQPDNAAVRVELSRVLTIRGDIERAVAVAEEAVQLEPQHAAPREQLASILADAGDGARLAAVAGTLVTMFPDREDARYYDAVAAFLHGRAGEAAEKARQLLRTDPGHARAQTLLGAACAAAGARECARTAFETALALNPREPSSFVNLGAFYLEGGEPGTAADYFVEALVLDPQSAAARAGLVQTRLRRDSHPP